MYTKLPSDAKITQASNSTLSERLTALTLAYDFAFKLRVLSLDFTLLSFGLRHLHLSRIIGWFEWESKLVFRYGFQRLLVVFVCLGLLAYSRECRRYGTIHKVSHNMCTNRFVVCPR